MAKQIRVVMEYNKEGYLLYAENYCGAFTRGKTKELAISKFSNEISQYKSWITDGKEELEEDYEVIIEKLPNYLENKVFIGSYNEEWSLRKVLRRFIWHDRIHAKAMYKMAAKTWNKEELENPFYFDTYNVLL